MGAEYATDFVPDVPDLNEAYRIAVEDALRSHGNGGYTGTIAESGGVRLYRNDPIPLEEAYRIALRRQEDGAVQKWEAFEAIAIATEDSFAERIVTKIIKVNLNRQPYRDELPALVTPHVGLREGEKVKSATILKDEPSWRVAVTVPEGDRRIVYKIEGVPGLENNEYVTVAAARRDLTEAAKNWGQPAEGPNIFGKGLSPLKARIFGTVDRGWRQVETEPDFEGRRWPRPERIPMVEAVTELKDRKLTVEATLYKSKGKPKFHGWFFYGIASS